MLTHWFSGYGVIVLVLIIQRSRFIFLIFWIIPYPVNINLSSKLWRLGVLFSRSFFFENRTFFVTIGSLEFKTVSWFISISSFNFSPWHVTSRAPWVFTIQTSVFPHFNFSKENIVKRITGLAGLISVFPNAVCNQYINQFLQDNCLAFSGHDFHHLPDLEDLLVLYTGPIWLLCF